MPIKCRYRFHGHIPFALEHKLISKYGFRVHSRNQGKWVIYEKEVKLVKQKTDEDLIIDDDPPVEMTLKNPEAYIPWDRQGELIRRCNAVVDYFLDPYGSARQIRTRLNNFAQVLNPVEAQFVRDWADRNIEKVS